MQVLLSITSFTFCFSAAHCQLTIDLIICDGFVSIYMCLDIFNLMFENEKLINSLGSMVYRQRRTFQLLLDEA